MNTLVLRHVPDDLYRRLKAVAAAHRRSMNQEAILALEAGLPGGPPTQRPSPEETRRWLEQQVPPPPEKLTPLHPDHLQHLGA